MLANPKNNFQRQRCVSESLTLLDEVPQIAQSSRLTSHASIGYESNLLRVGGSEPNSRRNSDSKNWCSKPYKPSLVATGHRTFTKHGRRVSILSQLSGKSSESDIYKKSALYDFGRATHAAFRRLSKSKEKDDTNLQWLMTFLKTKKAEYFCKFSKILWNLVCKTISDCVFASWAHR